MQRSKNIVRILIGSFLLLLLTPLAKGQEGQNPFDLEHRLKEKKEQPADQPKTSEQDPFDLKDRKETIAPPQDAPSKESKDENPFDLNRKAEPSTTPKSSSTKQESDNPFDLKTTPSPTSETDKNTNTKPPTPLKKAKKEDASGFVFWTILLMMIFLALEVTLFKSLINKVYRAFTNDNILKLLHREQRDIISFPYLLLYIFFFVNFGLFAFLTFHFFGYVPKSLTILLYCIGGTGVLFLLKHILLKIIELVFPVQKEIKQYSFSLVIFSSILGFALVPFNIIVAFASPSIAKIALYGGLLTIFGITVFCILRGLFLASKYLSFHKFHFFMYLCTVEIAPVLIVAKLLLLKSGIH